MDSHHIKGDGGSIAIHGGGSAAVSSEGWAGRRSGTQEVIDSGDPYTT
jgi:hypothetical protein